MPVKDVVISLDYFPEIGGAHTWMHEVYTRWPRGVDLLAKDYGDDPGLSEAQKEFDSKDHGSLLVHRVPVGFSDISLFNPAFIHGVATLIRKIGAVVSESRVRIHSLRAFPDGIAALGYKLGYKNGVHRQTRMVTYVHGEELKVAETSRQLRFLTRQVLKHSDLVIVNSRATSRRLNIFMGREIPVRIIHPGVDAAAYEISPGRIKQLRNAWGCGTNAIVLATVARMEPRKNQANVIRALSLLQKKGLRLTYVIAGGGAEKKALVRLAASLGVEDQVLFPGIVSQEEKIAIFGAADIHVMPSVEKGSMVEGFGIVFLEAAAAGTPSIGGNSGGQAEAVCHGETGLIVDGEDIDQLAEAIQTLAEDSDMREGMGRQGRAFAVKNDWQQVVAATVRSVEGLERACS